SAPPTGRVTRGRRREKTRTSVTPATTSAMLPEYSAGEFRGDMLVPATRPGRLHAQLRRYRPARPALPADDRAHSDRRGPRLRVRLDVRLAHPVGGVLRDAAARREGDEQDQARAF